MSVGDPWWPLAGFRHLATHPGLWPLALAVVLGSGLVAAASGGLLLWWLWPGDFAWTWAWWGDLGLAVGAAGAGLVLGWLLVVPVAMSLVLEELACRALVAAGGVAAPPALWRGMQDSLKAVAADLPWRLLWALAALVAGLVFAPLGLLVGALAVGRAAVRDAADTALAVAGAPWAERRALLRTPTIRAAMPVAAGCHLGLTWTLFGWLLLPAALACGAGLRAAAWQRQTRSSAAQAGG
jgi:hypothetical protein